MRLHPIVDDSIILELKSVDEITSLYEAQLLTYLKLSAVGSVVQTNEQISVVVKLHPLPVCTADPTG